MDEPHARSERRSVRYHALIAERLEGDPSIVVRARTRVEGWLRDGSVHPEYARGWKSLLEGPVEALRAFLTAQSDRARAFRQVTPFAGALDPRERWLLWAQERP